MDYILNAAKIIPWHFLFSIDYSMKKPVPAGAGFKVEVTVSVYDQLGMRLQGWSRNPKQRV